MSTISLLRSFDGHCREPGCFSNPLWLCERGEPALNAISSVMLCPGSGRGLEDSLKEF
jgi:hypothetical protein